MEKETRDRKITTKVSKQRKRDGRSSPGFKIMKTTIQGLLLAIIFFALATTLPLHAAEQNGTKRPVPPTPTCGHRQALPGK